LRLPAQQHFDVLRPSTFVPAEATCVPAAATSADL